MGSRKTTNQKAGTYETTMPLLKSMYLEIKDISKKKPDAIISPGKISIINRLLTRVRTVLCDESSIEFLDILEEESVPQASDVALMLSQYVAAMEAFHERYYGWDGTEHAWFTK